MGIGVTRVSQDETRVEFCREILSELFGTEWALVARVSGFADSKDDLCVWDFMAAETAIPQDLEPSNPRRQWFVVHRKDLHALQAAVGSDELSELLKPITRDALAKLFDGASPHGNEQIDDIRRTRGRPPRRTR